MIAPYFPPPCRPPRRPSHGRRRTDGTAWTSTLPVPTRWWQCWPTRGGLTFFDLRWPGGGCPVWPMRYGAVRPRYDMEDAMIINKSSMERGFCHGQIYKVRPVPPPRRG